MYKTSDLRSYLRGLGVSANEIKIIIDAGGDNEATDDAIVSVSKLICRSPRIRITRVDEDHELVFESNVTAGSYAIDAKVPPRDSEFRITRKKK